MAALLLEANENTHPGSVLRAYKLIADMRMHKAEDKINCLLPLAESGFKAAKGRPKGRLEGAKKNRERAMERAEQFRQIYRDMRGQKPDWKLDEHAEYVLDWSKKHGIPMGNGKPYSLRRILDIITGERRRARHESGQSCGEKP